MTSDTRILPDDTPTSVYSNVVDIAHYDSDVSTRRKEISQQDLSSHAESKAELGLPVAPRSHNKHHNDTQETINAKPCVSFQSDNASNVFHEDLLRSTSSENNKTASKPEVLLGNNVAKVAKVAVTNENYRRYGEALLNEDRNIAPAESINSEEHSSDTMETHSTDIIRASADPETAIQAYHFSDVMSVKIEPNEIVTITTSKPLKHEESDVSSFYRYMPKSSRQKIIDGFIQIYLSSPAKERKLIRDRLAACDEKLNADMPPSGESSFKAPPPFPPTPSGHLRVNYGDDFPVLNAVRSSLGLLNSPAYPVRPKAQQHRYQYQAQTGFLNTASYNELPPEESSGYAESYANHRSQRWYARDETDHDTSSINHPVSYVRERPSNTTTNEYSMKQPMAHVGNQVSSRDVHSFQPPSTVIRPPVHPATRLPMSAYSTFSCKRQLEGDSVEFERPSIRQRVNPSHNHIDSPRNPSLVPMPSPLDRLSSPSPPAKRIVIKDNEDVEDVFFVSSSDPGGVGPAICKYECPVSGRTCNAVLTRDNKRSRYRHLATHVQIEEIHIKNGHLKTEDAVLLPLLKKIVVTCILPDCDFSKEVWRSDGVREGHEKTDHPAFYKQRQELKLKKKGDKGKK